MVRPVEVTDGTVAEGLLSLRLLDAGPSRAGWSRLQLALLCPRKYALWMAQRADPTYVRPARVAPDKGTLFHTALAHRYTLRADPGADVLSPLDAIRVQAERSPHNLVWRGYVQELQETYLEYDLHWGRETWKTVAVEKELSAQIEDLERGCSYLYTQRLDLAVEDPRTGKIYFVDHKTCGRLTANTAKKYALSGQFRGYNMFGRGLLGDKFGGTILNLIQHPLKGKRQFQRAPLEIAPYADKTFRDTVIHAERIIHDLTERHTDPMDWPGAHHEHACWTTYGACKNTTLCTWGTT